MSADTTTTDDPTQGRADHDSGQPRRVPSPAAILADAFHVDPLFSWAQPDAARRRRGLRALFAGTLRKSRGVGGAPVVGGGGAVATWVPSERVPVTAGDVLRYGMITAPLWLGAGAVARLGRHDDQADAAIARHAGPDAAYLWALGADPARRGEGLGRRAVEQVVRDVRAAGYDRLLLKTENPDNVGLYLHLGFELVDEQGIAASGLTASIFSRRVAGPDLGTVGA